MKEYSHSKLSCFEKCPKQYEYRYIKRIKVDTEGVEAFVGKRVHEILERLYHHIRRHRRPPSLAQVQERFRQDWAALWHPKVQIVRTEYDTEFYQGLGQRCLENYYRSYYPFDQDETVALEHKVSIQLDDSGRYRARGIIDRLVRNRDKGYEIHDYKTSQTLPGRSRLDQDRQLALYQIGIEQAYPDAQSVKLVWHYLSFNKTLKSERSPAQLDTLRNQTIEKIDEIEATRTYPAQPSALCRWCEYRELCPEAALDARGLAGSVAEATDPALGAATVADPSKAGNPEGIQLSLLD